MKSTENYRRIPAVERVVSRLPAALVSSPPARAGAVEAAREVVASLRQRIRAGGPVDDAECTVDAVAEATAARARARFQGSLGPVVNGTGIVLHTNLGRAPLAPEWLDEARDRAAGYCNLEYDIAARRRGSRSDHAAGLLLRLVPAAEAALVVNNGAAAVLLALAALARDREVVVSRGELVEIGGGFRVPDVMAASGARLVEVGTTNRTRIADFAAAIGPSTGMLFQAHRSNFRMIGFVEDVPLADLVSLGRRRRVPVVLDLGSGKVSDPGVEVARDEPGPQQALEAGADLVCFSGDKLLGGPQAGILLGRHRVIARLKAHPLLRAVRVDKVALAVLEAALRRHLAGDLDAIPALAALRVEPGTVKRRCEALVRAARRAGVPGAVELRVVATRAEAGGGTLPARPIPSWGVGIRVEGVPDSRVDAFLRAREPPILGRVRSGAVVLDLRTFLPGQAAVVVRALAALADGVPSGSPAATGPCGDRDDED